jgi:diguanylate cyclase (GGDEF)-like protein
MQRRTGALEAAQATLDGVMEMCLEHNLVGMSTELIGEQAEMHAARGDFEQAFVTFKEFHLAFTAFTGVEREAQARTMQAIYETDEARRDSERFRELSVRDPLTGLGNRRYVDEELRIQLLHAVDVGEPLTLAIVDLDHFKVVNDQRSHEVGDQVLVELARILEASVAGHPGATASRLGGEEFLVLLPGAGRSQGAAILNRLCREVREHPWGPITSGIAVTASVGVATAPQDGVDRAQLLSCADRRLYAAKHAGRDRVVAHDRPTRLAPAS